MTEAFGQSATRHGFFGAPESWVGWTSVGLLLLAAVSIFNRRFTGGFRGVFAVFIAAGAVALVGVLWKKERSVLVWIPLVIGVLATVWTGAELLFPH